MLRLRPCVRVADVKRFLTSLLICCMALPAAAAGVHEVRTVDELNELLQEAADAIHEEVTIRFSGQLRGKHVQRILGDSLWTNHCRQYDWTPLSKKEHELRFTYMDSTRMLAAHRNPELERRLNKVERKALEEARRRIKQSVTKGMSNLEIVQALHDSLVEDVHYDKKGDPACTTMLLKHKGVCDAYSRCMYLMLNMLDIPCHMVVGKVKQKVHAWNLVQLEPGEWYHVDATWDDPCMPDNTQVVRHTYFCLTDAELRGDHKWNARQYPATPEKKGYFYRKVNRYFTTYDEFWADAQRAFDRGEVNYSAYLTCFGSARRFNRNYKDYKKNGGTIGLESWAQPSDMQRRVISLTFSNKKSKPDEDLPEPDDESTLPIAEETSWLSIDMWNRVSELADMGAIAEEGSKMMQKGMDSVEEMAEEYSKPEGGVQEKAKAAWDGLMNKIRH